MKYQIKEGDKIQIIGSSKHGKDTLAEILRDTFGLTFSSSSYMALNIFLYDILKKKYGYKTKEECFNDRHSSDEMANEWYEHICEYNKKDKSRLTKEILKSNDMYVGIRDFEEFKYCRSLYNIIIYVDANERIKEKDLTMKIPKEEADIIIDNNGTLNEFKEKIKNIFYK